jgi:hypothetical protein
MMQTTAHRCRRIVFAPCPRLPFEAFIINFVDHGILLSRGVSDGGSKIEIRLSFLFPGMWNPLDLGDCLEFSVQLLATELMLN